MCQHIIIQADHTFGIIIMVINIEIIILIEEYILIGIGKTPIDIDGKECIGRIIDLFDPTR
jgi:hypothetical protein